MFYFQQTPRAVVPLLDSLIAQYGHRFSLAAKRKSFFDLVFELA